ncbi:MAG: HAD family hydrolase [Clostridia bacterium]|nr:HAD family hydrolase [Clostridia bacterium]
MEIRNIIYDVYGTLISTGTGSVDATRKILMQSRSPVAAALDPQEVYRDWKAFHRENIDRVNAALFDTEKHLSEVEFVNEREIFTRDLARIYQRYGIDGDPQTDVQPMLDSLSARALFPEVRCALLALSQQYRQAIGSTTDTAPLLQNFARTALCEMDGTPLFSYVFTSEMLGVYKPQREFYLRILEQAGWRAEETVFVGDSITDDVLGPRAVGLRTVLLDRKGRYRGMHETIGADAVIASLDALADALHDLSA